jgi:hypothetical protein
MILKHLCINAAHNDKNRFITKGTKEKTTQHELLKLIYFVIIFNQQSLTKFVVSVCI